MKTRNTHEKWVIMDATALWWMIIGKKRCAGGTMRPKVLIPAHGEAWDVCEENF